MHLYNEIGKAVINYTPDVFWKTYSVSNQTTPKLIFSQPPKKKSQDRIKK